jgi:hypothetical protein
MNSGKIRVADGEAFEHEGVYYAMPHIGGVLYGVMVIMKSANGRQLDRVRFHVMNAEQSSYTLSMKSAETSIFKDKRKALMMAKLGR